MDKHNNNSHQTTRLDIEEADLYRNETDSELHGHEREALDPDDLPNPDAVKAALKYGRDSYMVKSDIDPDEDNYVPGLREQD